MMIIKLIISFHIHVASKTKYNSNIIIIIITTKRVKEAIKICKKKE